MGGPFLFCGKEGFDEVGQRTPQPGETEQADNPGGIGELLTGELAWAFAPDDDRRTGSTLKLVAGFGFEDGTFGWAGVFTSGANDGSVVERLLPAGRGDEVAVDNPGGDGLVTGPTGFSKRGNDRVMMDGAALPGAGRERVHGSVLGVDDDVGEFGKLRVGMMLNLVDGNVVQVFAEEGGSLMAHALSSDKGGTQTAEAEEEHGCAVAFEGSGGPEHTDASDDTGDEITEAAEKPDGHGSDGLRDEDDQEAEKQLVMPAMEAGFGDESHESVAIGSIDASTGPWEGGEFTLKVSALDPTGEAAFGLDEIPFIVEADMFAFAGARGGVP